MSPQCIIRIPSEPPLIQQKTSDITLGIASSAFYCGDRRFVDVEHHTLQDFSGFSRNAWFQQYGATSVFTCEILPEKFISRWGIISWLTCSLDLTQMDFSLWGCFKSQAARPFRVRKGREEEKKRAIAGADVEPLPLPARTHHNRESVKSCSDGRPEPELRTVVRIKSSGVER
ncbi:hypothetical protein Trydic_g20918 [Trypoxylus dichotomus]